MTPQRISIFAAAFLALLGTFYLGMWASFKEWAPWQTVTTARTIWQSYRATGRVMRENTYTHRDHAWPKETYKIHDPAAMAPGYLAINRFRPDEQRFVSELLDASGAVVHSWPIDYSEIVEGGSSTEFVHAAKPLPDGTLLVDFDDGHAVARLDVCGHPIWARTDKTYHHLIERDGDGSWVWQATGWDGSQDQNMVRIDNETGEITDSISLIDDVFATDPNAAMRLTIPPGFVFNKDAPPDTLKDMFHPNDVEPLLAEMAAAFPQFSAGDLLVSLRNLDTIAVISRKTHKLLWSQQGPWLMQHDPDFQPDGTITVYSNNPDRNRSTLFRVDPKTGQTSYALDVTSPAYFSWIMGTHQKLPNGNWMISVPKQGRVLEISATGAPVREYNNIIDANYNSFLTHAELLPTDFFTELPHCDTSGQGGN
jgi:hypothetical protein